MTPATKNPTRQASSPQRASTPTVGAGVVRGLLEFGVFRGADRAMLCRRSGLDFADLSDDDNRIPFHRYAALMKSAQALCDEPALALQFGEAVDLSEVSVLGLICRASETMLDAFRQMNRYGQLVVEADHQQTGDRFRLERRDGKLWLVDNRVIPEDFPEMVELAFAQMACGTRPFGTTPFVLGVHLAYPAPGHAGEYNRVFQAPVTFNAAWNAMHVDEAWLTHRVAVAPRYVFGILSQHAQAMLERLESSRSFRGRVEMALMPVLHTGSAGLDGVAKALGLGRRTLSRRLADEGATFEQVLDDLRHALALHYLAEGKVSITETAYLVGFSDPSAFSRAYKRWTGSSPRGART